MARARGAFFGFLLVSCGALGLVVYAETQHDFMPKARQLMPSAKQADQVISLEQAPLFQPRPLTNYEEIVARPVFTESRRPPPSEEQPVAAVLRPSMGQYVLTGLVISRDQRIALVGRWGGDEVWKVGVGQEIDGWRVTAITGNSVILEMGEVRDEILFIEDEEMQVRDLGEQTTTRDHYDRQVQGRRIRSGGQIRR